MKNTTQICCGHGSKGKLVKAAFELLASKGFESTGINEILENAGVTKSNFYYHFKSKEELCLTTLDYMENYFFENVVNKTLLDMTLKPQERLRRYFDFTLERMTCDCCKKGCPFVNLGNETSDFYPSFREKIARVNSRHLQAIETCIVDGLNAGDFHNGLDAASMAKLILATVNGSVILSKVFKKIDVLNENITALMAILCPSAESGLS